MPRKRYELYRNTQNTHRVGIRAFARFPNRSERVKLSCLCSIYRTTLTNGQSKFLKSQKCCHSDITYMKGAIRRSTIRKQTNYILPFRVCVGSLQQVVLRLD